MPKSNFKDFYDQVRREFPKTVDLDTWTKNDWTAEDCFNPAIMSDLCREMARWAMSGMTSDAQRMMDLVDLYFREDAVPVSQIMYSDFLVTIMEQKKEAREAIKKMMGRTTWQNYLRLLHYYRESDS